MSLLPGDEVYIERISSFGKRERVPGIIQAPNPEDSRYCQDQEDSDSHHFIQCCMTFEDGPGEHFKQGNRTQAGAEMLLVRTSLNYKCNEKRWVRKARLIPKDVAHEEALSRLFSVIEHSVSFLVEPFNRWKRWISMHRVQEMQIKAALRLQRSYRDMLYNQVTQRAQSLKVKILSCLKTKRLSSVKQVLKQQIKCHIQKRRQLFGVCLQSSVSEQRFNLSFVVAGDTRGNVENLRAGGDRKWFDSKDELLDYYAVMKKRIMALFKLCQRVAQAQARFYFHRFCELLKRSQHDEESAVSSSLGHDHLEAYKDLAMASFLRESPFSPWPMTGVELPLCGIVGSDVQMMQNRGTVRAEETGGRTKQRVAADLSISDVDAFSFFKRFIEGPTWFTRWALKPCGRSKIRNPARQTGQRAEDQRHTVRQNTACILFGSFLGFIIPQSQVSLRENMKSLLLKNIGTFVGFVSETELNQFMSTEANPNKLSFEEYVTDVHAELAQKMEKRHQEAERKLIESKLLYERSVEMRYNEAFQRQFKEEYRKRADIWKVCQGELMRFPAEVEVKIQVCCEGEMLEDREVMRTCRDIEKTIRDKVQKQRGKRRDQEGRQGERDWRSTGAGLFLFSDRVTDQASVLLSLLLGRWFHESYSDVSRRVRLLCYFIEYEQYRRKSTDQDELSNQLQDVLKNYEAQFHLGCVPREIYQQHQIKRLLNAHPLNFLS